MHGLTGGGWKRKRPDQGREEEQRNGKPLHSLWLHDLPSGFATAPVPDPPLAGSAAVVGQPPELIFCLPIGMRVRRSRAPEVSCSSLKPSRPLSPGAHSPLGLRSE